MSFKPLLTTALAMAIVLSLNAQEFLRPANTFSRSKTAYVTLQDGTTVEGEISKLKRKKGLIEEIRIEKENGDKVKIEPTNVAFMYLPPSGFDKLDRAMEEAFDTQLWDNEEVESELIQEGYAYFEQAQVLVKKKEQTMLMQLLNPHFASKLKVYHDPFAKETASVGVGGFTVAGGIDKSYYVQQGDETAFRLYKKDYKKEQFAQMWKDCPAVAEQYGEDIDWDELVKHIMAYSECK
jgi:hypothetical protein